MSGDLHGLYGEIVLDHGRQPRNRRAIAAARTNEQRNPLCGDRVTVYATFADGRIADVSFDGSACAIVMAAASMMTEAVVGRRTSEALALADRVGQMLTAPAPGPLDDLGPLSALAGVRQFPMRIRCALLPWQALRGVVGTAPAARSE